MTFEKLSNEDFLRFIINNEKSLVGALHRESFVRAIVNWIAEHLCLSIDKSVEATEMGLAEIYFDYKLQRMDVNNVNLHYEGFNRSWRKGVQMKKLQIAAGKNKRKIEKELKRYLTGLA